MQTIKIFLSSPSDVADERARAEKVIEELNATFAGQSVIELFRWEESFYSAADTFQGQIMRPADANIVVCVFWKRLGSTLSDEFNRPDGTARTGTEFEFEEALEAAREREPRCPDILVYRKTEKIFFSEDNLEQERQEKKILDEFWARWFRNEHGHFTSSFKTFQTVDEFAETLEADIRAWLRKRAGDVAWDIATMGSPFRGLEPFDEGHASVFFGRAREIDRARAKLVESAAKGFPALFILGASGSGKSSLMRAGLAPRLLAPASTPQVERFARLVTSPNALGQDPFDRLARQLFSVPQLSSLSGGAFATSAQFGAALRDRPEEAAAELERALGAWGETLQKSEKRGAPPTTGLLLCLDQFEEVFARSQQRRAELAATLKALVRTGRVWLVITMRSDFFEPLLLDPALRDLKDSSAVLEVAPPTSADIRDIVQRPAAAARLKFETSADGRRSLLELIEAEANQPGALPMVQFLLDRLFELRNITTQTLTLQTYDSLGGAAGALAAHAADVISSVSKPAQESFGRLVRGLVKVDAADARPTARFVPLSMFPPDTPIRELVDALAHARLLTVSSDGLEADASTANSNVRLAHEALLERWDDLRQEVARNLRDLQTRERLDQSFALWNEAEGKNRNRRLLRDLELEEGIDLAKRWGDELPEPLRDFVSKSNKKDAQTRRGQTVRWALAGVVGVAAVAAVAMAWFTFDNAKQVTAQRDAARVLGSRLLADAARQMLDDDSALKAGLLASEALSDAAACKLEDAAPRCGEALAVLRSAVSRVLATSAVDQPTAVLDMGDTVIAVNMSPGGDVFASPRWNNKIDIRKTSSGALVRSLRLAGCGDTNNDETPDDFKCMPASTVFLASKPSLLAAYGDGSLVEWSLETGAVVEAWPAPAAKERLDVTTLEFNSSGDLAFVKQRDGGAWVQVLKRGGAKRLVTGEPNDGCFTQSGRALALIRGGKLQLEDVANPSVVQRSDLPGELIRCSPDGRRLILLTGDEVAVVDSTSLEAIGSVARPKAEGRKDWAMALSRDGRLFAVGGEEGRLEVYSVDTVRAVNQLRTGAAAIYGLDFAPDGAVITGGREGQLALWRSVAEGAGAASHPIRLEDDDVFFDGGRVALRRIRNGDNKVSAIAMIEPATGRVLGEQSLNALTCRSASADDCELDDYFWAFDRSSFLLATKGRVTELDASFAHIGGADLPSEAADDLTDMRAGVALAKGPDNVAYPLFLRENFKVRPIVHSADISATAISARGDVIVTGDQNGAVRVLLKGANEKPRVWYANDKEVPIEALTVSPDNLLVASADGEGVVRLSTLSGQILSEYRAGEEMGRIEFAPDGLHLIGWSGETAYRWRVDRGSASSRGNPASIGEAALVLDGRAQAKGDLRFDDRTGQLYDVTDDFLGDVAWTRSTDLPVQVLMAVAKVIADAPLDSSERAKAQLPKSASPKKWPADRNACDEWASQFTDPDSMSRGIYYKDIDLDDAEEACGSARRDNPKSGHYLSLYARVLETRAKEAEENGDLDDVRKYLAEAHAAADGAAKLGYRYAKRQLGLYSLIHYGGKFDPAAGVNSAREAWRAGVAFAARDLTRFYERGSLADAPNYDPKLMDAKLARLWMDRGALALDPASLGNEGICWNQAADGQTAVENGSARCAPVYSSSSGIIAKRALALYHYDLASQQKEFLDATGKDVLEAMGDVRDVALKLSPDIAGCVHIEAATVMRKHWKEPDQTLKSTRDFCRRTLSENKITLAIGTPLVDEARREDGKGK